MAGTTFPLAFAPSGTFVYSTYRDDIIRQAMLNLGLLEQSEVPTAQELVDCARVLNMIVKQIAGQLDRAPGFKMWQRVRGDLFLSAQKYVYQLGGTSTDNFAAATTGLTYPNSYGQHALSANVAAGISVLNIGTTNFSSINVNDYVGVQYTNSAGQTDIFWSTISSTNPGAGQITMAAGLPSGTSAAAGGAVWNYTTPGQRPMKVLTALLRDSTQTDTPLTEMTLEQYEALPTKTMATNLADPTAWYYEARMIGNQGHFYIDCGGAQDITKLIHMVFLRESMDFNNPLDAPEYPQEWFWHLSWSLSLGICPMFDADWTQDRQSAYVIATTQAREGNPQVTAAYFQPEDDDMN